MDGSKIRIGNVGEALSLLEKLKQDDFSFSEKDYESLELFGEIAELAIEISGPNFHGTITGGLARGLWYYQREIYKAVAFAIYNSDNYGRIPKPELKNYTLVFDVDDGCTELLAKTLDIGKSLVEKAMDGMTPKEKAALLLSILLGLGGFAAAGWVATAFSEDYFSHKTAVQTEQYKAAQAEAASETEVERIRAEVERDKIQADLVASAIGSSPIASRFNAATAEGVKSIAKYSPEATSLKVGSVELDRAQIEELNQRSSREIPDVFNIVGYYRVTSTTEPTPEGVVRVGLAGNGDEFTAHMNLKDEDHPIADEQSNAVFLAPKTGEKLYINVRMKKASDGIREAYIESFPPAPKQAEIALAAPPPRP
ncbi:hypothetical protein [Pusillimonas noertemannii]|nr:hypothetical protein [Pusillimonas noertemannii]NYT67945.1 hypothetical protein [Pusillimonas noertemannii]TFL11914.1 hypothetical protein CSC72_01930 [Pusillimonas noertemannii]